MDIGLGNQQVTGLPRDDAIGATAIEIAGNNGIVAATLHTDDTTVAVASFGMADGQVLHLTTAAVHETQAEGIAGIDLDTGIMLTADHKVAHILEHQLLTIVAIFADDRWLASAIALGDGHPRTTRNAREPILALQDS